MVQRRPQRLARERKFSVKRRYVRAFRPRRLHRRHLNRLQRQATQKSDGGGRVEKK